MHNAKIKEKGGRALFATAAVICVIAAIAIFGFMFARSAPAFRKIGVMSFIFGEEWSPAREDRYEDEMLSGSYGIGKMVVGTMAATVGAVAIGGTLGYYTAVFLAFFCPKRCKRFFSAMVRLLAGIPSVVYGFFGIVFLLPLLSNIAPNNGSGLLATSLILGIMILPTVVSLSQTSLEAVPRTWYEGALALGATHARAVFGTVTKAARSGICASLLLGVGRALGETMAVVMVAGNSVAWPDSLFRSFRTMTANIVMEMGYAGEVQQGALVATGVVLLVFVLLVDLLFGAISGRAVSGAVARRTRKPKSKENAPDRRATAVTGRFFRTLRDAKETLGYKLNASRLNAGCAIGAGIVTAAALLLVIGFVLIKGLPPLLSKPHLLFGQYRFDSEEITVLPAIVTTLMTVLLSLAVAVPLGICAAIYLNEYAKQTSPLVRMARAAIDVLGGVPSIVYGLFGMIVFVPLIRGTSTILAGSLTVSVMLLPTVVRSTEESLRSVPDSLREGSLALGAGKVRTIMKVVLPSALPGIVSAVILSMGRVIGESAPFIYTMGSVISAVPTSYLDSNATLAVALYRLAGEGWYLEEAYATAVILVVLVLGLNCAAEWIAGRLNRKLKGESR